jgi:hypothetical protein
LFLPSGIFLNAIALLVSLPLPRVTSAQVVGPKPSDWSAVTARQPGEKLAVKLKDGKNVEGLLSRLSDTTLTLSHKNATFDLNWDDVLKVYRLSKGSAKRSTLVGAGIGAVIGVGTSSENRLFIPKMEFSVRTGNLSGFQTNEITQSIQSGLSQSA